MGDRMPASLVCDALRMALFNRRMPRGVIMPKGNCYDNAAMESWNHSLQVEAIHGERFATREQAWVYVFEYIEVDYNRSRVHWTAGYLSPDQFEQANAAWAGVRKAGGDHLVHKAPEGRGVSTCSGDWTAETNST